MCTVGVKQQCNNNNNNSLAEVEVGVLILEQSKEAVSSAPDKKKGTCNRDNLGIINHIRDGSNEWSQHMFSFGNKKNYL